MIKCHANKCIFLWMPIDFCWQRALPTLLPPLRLHTQHTWKIPFGFLFQASMLVVLLCRSLIKILKVNQFVCLLPRGLSPFTPHFSKILKKVQFRDLHLIDAKHLKCSVCWLKKVLKYFKKVSHYFTFLELSESFWYLSPMPSYNML